MAEVYTSTAAMQNTVLAEQINNIALEAITANNIIAPLIANFNAENARSNVFSIPVYGSVSAATIGETTEMTSTAFSDTQNSITYGEVGVMTIVQDKYNEVRAVADAASAFGRAAGHAIGVNIDQAISALFPALGGGTNVGTTDVTLTYGAFLRGLYTLENANVHGPMVSVLHPVQAHQLRDSITSTTATAIGWGNGSTFGVTAADATGFVGQLMGIKIHQTTNVGTANGATADKVGSLMATSQEESPLAIAQWRKTRTEMDRKVERRGTAIVVTNAYGVVEIRDTTGVGIVSKSTPT